jgi:hypothetical protein
MLCLEVERAINGKGSNPYYSRVGMNCFCLLCLLLYSMLSALFTYKKLRRACLPLSTKKSESKRRRIKSDFGSLGEIKHVTGQRMDPIALIVGYEKFPRYNNLHFVIFIRVDQWNTRFLAVKSRCNGLLTGRAFWGETRKIWLENVDQMTMDEN